MGREAVHQGQRQADACQWATAESDASAGARRDVISDGCRAVPVLHRGDAGKWADRVLDGLAPALRQSVGLASEPDGSAPCTPGAGQSAARSCAAGRSSVAAERWEPRALPRTALLQAALRQLAGQLELPARQLQRPQALLETWAR
jgi:hypothetical protein